MTTGTLARWLCLILLVTVSAAADERDGLEQLMNELARVESSEANYSEQKHIVFLDTEILQNGRLAYVAPDNVIRELLTPAKERFEAKEDLLTVDRKDFHQQVSLQSVPGVAAFIESFRGTLSGDLELLRTYYNVDFTGNLELWKLVLTPRQKEMKRYVSSVVMRGKSVNIATIEVFERNGDWSRLTLTTVNRKLRER